MKKFTKLEKTILYIEDDKNTQDEVLLFLQRLSDNVIVGDNGQEGLELFNNNNIDLVITDIKMPIMDGLEMSKCIRSLNKDIPIIILSAFNESELLLEALNNGINGYLFKPVNLKEMKKTIFKHVGDEEENYLSQILNKEFDIIGVNENWLNILGYTKDEVLGKSFIDFIDEKFVDTVKNELKKFNIISEIDNIHLQLICKDGLRKEFMLHGDIVSSDNVEYTIKCELQSMHQILSSKQNIIKLLQHEKYLKNLIYSHANIGKSATSSEKISCFLNEITEQFINIANYDWAVVSSINKRDKLKVLAYSHNIDYSVEDKKERIKPFKEKDSVSYEVIVNNALYVVDNIDNLENECLKDRLKSDDIHSIVGIPIRLEKDGISNNASLTLMMRKSHVFTKEELELFHSIGDTISLGVQSIKSKIEKEELLKELHIRATSDFLTKCINRQEAIRILNKEISRVRRYNEKLSIIFIDIDFFKVINDKYGHQTGDQVLISFSEKIQENLRESDILCRWGGEEFVLILPEMNLESTIQLTKKLQEKLKSICFKDIKITASFGLTEYKKSDSWESLVGRADKLMYESKVNGRNRYTIG